jgi:hypothetical protein
MKEASSIELFKNLTQFEYNNQIVDLHNDYNCQDISFANGVVLLRFISCIDSKPLVLRFEDVALNSFNFFNVKGNEQLTIDTLYRGRYEVNGELIETSDDNRAYFYLEFYTGQKMEFWAGSFGLTPERI